jgi:hypothetical protein
MNVAQPHISTVSYQQLMVYSTIRLLDILINPYEQKMLHSVLVSSMWQSWQEHKHNIKQWLTV